MKRILLIFLIFFSITISSFAANVRVTNDAGIYEVEVINLSKLDLYIPNGLETVVEAGEKTGAKIIINGGYFDPKNAKTVSYLEKGKEEFSPKDNNNLTTNKDIQPYLKAIYNRSEFRLYDLNGKLIPDIAFHNDKKPTEAKLIFSMQAGPMLLPKNTSEKEAFLVKKNGKVIRASAGNLDTMKRTILGIKKNMVYVYIFSNKIYIKDVIKYLKSKDIEKAISLDGGSSTSLYITGKGLIIPSDKSQVRQVKSMLIIK